MALAHAELYLILAKLFRRRVSAGHVGGDGQGDRRPIDFGILKIFETTTWDREMVADYLIPIPVSRMCHLLNLGRCLLILLNFQGTKGLQIVFKPLKMVGDIMTLAQRGGCEGRD
jgi:hypothetical protein